MGLEPSPQYAAQIEVLVFDVVAKEDAATLHLFLWVAVFKLTPLFMAKFSNSSKVNRFASLACFFSHGRRFADVAFDPTS